jgi:hypothetical protein
MPENAHNNINSDTDRHLQEVKQGRKWYLPEGQERIL